MTKQKYTWEQPVIIFTIDLTLDLLFFIYRFCVFVYSMTQNKELLSPQ